MSPGFWMGYRVSACRVDPTVSKRSLHAFTNRTNPPYAGVWVELPPLAPPVRTNRPAFQDELVLVLLRGHIPMLVHVRNADVSWGLGRTASAYAPPVRISSSLSRHHTSSRSSPGSEKPPHSSLRGEPCDRPWQVRGRTVSGPPLRDGARGEVR